MISRKQSNLTNIRIIIEKVDTGTADCTEMWPVDMWHDVRCVLYMPHKVILNNEEGFNKKIDFLGYFLHPKYI